MNRKISSELTWAIGRGRFAEARDSQTQHPAAMGANEEGTLANGHNGQWVLQPWDRGQDQGLT